MMTEEELRKGPKVAVRNRFKRTAYIGRVCGKVRDRPGFWWVNVSWPKESARLMDFLPDFLQPIDNEQESELKNNPLTGL